MKGTEFPIEENADEMESRTGLADGFRDSILPYAYAPDHVSKSLPSRSPSL